MSDAKPTGPGVEPINHEGKFYWREGLRFIGEIPAGGQLMTAGPRIVLVAPGQRPSWVTATGLVPIELHELSADS